MGILPLPDDLTAGAMLVMLAGLALGALARGYSGFGFSAILVSSWALVTDPARAVVVALVPGGDSQRHPGRLGLERHSVEARGSVDGRRASSGRRSASIFWPICRANR